MESTTKTSGLRVRRAALKSNGRKTVSRSKYRSKAVKECHSALLPIFVITAVWSLGCWFLIWIRLYSSFTEDSAADPLSSLGKQRDNILAIRLKQFLDGNIPSESKYISSSNDRTNPMHDIHLVLKQAYDSEITKRVQQLLMADSQHPQLILGAYLEPPIEIDANGYMKLRTQGPDKLTHVPYPYQNFNEFRNTIGACSQNGAQWTLPTFHPPNMDNYFEGNVFRNKPMFEVRWDLALGIENDDIKGNSTARRGYCPVDADPYLPWIHDVFPSKDGARIEFVVSNKRRCNTDPGVFRSDLKNLEPQIALASNVCANFYHVVSRCHH